MDYKYKTTPFAHQDHGFRHARDRNFYAAYWEPGLGKSKHLLDVAAYKFISGKIEAVLIIAPNLVCRTWTKEQIPQHLPDYVHRRVALYRSSPLAAERDTMAELFHPGEGLLRILVVNVEALSGKKAMDFCKKFLRTFKTLTCVDESTTIKSPTAKRTKNILSLGDMSWFRWIMTGTPITHSPLDLYTQFEFMKPSLTGCGSWHGFRNRYAVMKKEYVGGGRSIDVVTGFQRLEELRRLIEGNGTVLKKADCLDLPRKIYQTSYVELSPTQRQLYKDLAANAVAQIDEDDTISVPLVLTKLLRLRQILCGFAMPDGAEEPIDLDANPRLDAMMLILSQTKEPTLIWATFRRSLATIHRTVIDQLGPCGIIHGGVTGEDRQDQLEAFQAGKMQFMAMQTRTGAYGITLTRATRALYFDNDWSLELRIQSEDRCHRIGQTKPVVYMDLVTPGSIDELVLLALKRKSNLADQVIQGTWRKLFELTA